MNKNKMMEQRTLATVKFNLRETEGQESRTIEGYAIRFNEPSEVLCDWENGVFRETIAPEAVTKEFLDQQDIKLTLYHNREKILARSYMGEGTLKYEVDEEGVKFSCELANDVNGQTALELVKRGDLMGCSFAYRDGQNAGSVTWGKGEDGVPCRTVHEMEGIYDMTLAADPAYPTTSVEKRELDTVLGVDTEAEEKRKAEEKKREEEEKLEEAAREAKEREYFLIRHGIRI